MLHDQASGTGYVGRGSGASDSTGSGKRRPSVRGKPRLVALATPPLFLEYEDVLKRPEHRLVHGLAPEAIDEFLAELARLVEPVERAFPVAASIRDANDEMVLEAAINGQADALVTYNVTDFAFGGWAIRNSNRVTRLNC